MIQNKISIPEICSILEIPISMWAIHSGMDFNQAVISLESFKEIAKTQRKQLAKKYHPDKTGGNDTKIKEINNILDILMKIQIQPPRPRPLVTVHFASSSSYTTTSSTYYRRW